MPSEPAFPRGTALGRYVLLERLGAGGMGVVYAAFDPELERKVAVKLLRSRPEDARAAAEGQARLLREAQAMARLSHPHVLPVFDVGVVGDRVFVAMELVEGRDARQWREQAPRTWAQVLAVYLQAARGLSAAHAAGLVHRDFKPENVLVGTDGRARVMDFGLARAAAGAPGAAGAAPHWRVTLEGQVQGTPAYMAPEQWRGEPADARSDQFAFCVALWEALAGQRPFASGGPADSRPTWPAPERRVPAAVRRALLLGLSASPDGRFASMKDLVAALERASRRRGLGLGVTLGLGALTAVLLVVAPRTAPPCSGAPARVESVWGPRSAARLERTFHSTGLPFAGDVLTTVRTELDAYAQGWSRLYTEACLATHERQAQPEAVLSLRMACLERRLGELGALVEVLSAADREVVARAPSAVHALTALEGCSDVAALLSQVPLPAGGEARARVDAVHRQLAQARALLGAGRYAEGVSLARALEVEARQAAHAPVHAEVLALLARLELEAGEAGAEARLLEARYATEASRLDALSAETAVHLSSHLWSRGERARAEEWWRHAEATLRRLGTDARLEALLLNRRAMMYATSNRYPEAVELTHRALALLEGLHGPEHPALAEPLLRAARYLRTGHEQEALGLARRALALRQRALGPDHPEVAEAWSTLGQLERDLRHPAAELEAQQRALAILERALGPEHPRVAGAHWDMAVAYENQGASRRALEHQQRAARLLEQTHGPHHHEAAVALLATAQLQHQLGHGREALATALTALERLEALHGADSSLLILEQYGVGELHELLGEDAAALERYRRAALAAERWAHPSQGSLAWLGQARLHLRHGRLGQARTLVRRALDIREHHHGPTHPELASALGVLARVALAEGRFEEAAALARRIAGCLAVFPPEAPEHAEDRLLLGLARLHSGAREEALALLREALKLREQQPDRVLPLAEARFELARALGPRNAEARALAVLARDTYVRAAARPRLAEVERFLADR
ncbi:serine/threonine-protein kinase [Pyxidicoccus xibeiensis]|uniref:serine/threonine-protein kinase n=1 Tax=Pyxidicoccus xibeiensis TaxID=2906759 RepID=UPI0020A710AC|nr:serine/threonine-protein kinase [Pyxidicoccus xibeiensis]MCP3138639.1 tetratricopeptide repeat protein [Pyxidicoccus xibeiensis]